MPPTIANNVFGVVGVIAAIVATIWFARWTWQKLPHPHNDLLHRLSEISVLLAEQNRLIKEVLGGSESGKLAPILAAIDTVAIHAQRQASGLNRLCAALGAPTEEDGGAPPEEATLRKKARRLMERYPGLTLKDAIEHVRMAEMYSSDSPMGVEANA